MRKAAVFFVLGMLVAAAASVGGQGEGSSAFQLAPTNHPPLPGSPSQFWLAPEKNAGYRTVASATLEAATKMMGRGEFSKALAAVQQPSTRQGPLSLYALYYTGRAHLELAHADESLEVFKDLRARNPVGYLSEAAALGAASAYEALNDPKAAIAIYEQLLENKPLNPADVYMRLGHASRAAHERNKAADAFGHVYYEFPLGDRADEARLELDKLYLEAPESGSARYQLDVGRAERLFAAKRYADARKDFDALEGRATPADRDLIALRLAECDFFLRRIRVAREQLRTLIDGGPRQGEALYFYAIASRDLGDTPTFLRLVRRLVDEFPTQTWPEDALNALATYHIVKDADDEADAVFRELYARYPRGRYAERAAWKAGWRAYRAGNYQDTVAFFERAAFDFPRSDYRPSWLYWAGRAHEQLNAQPIAEQRYALVIADYMNSYYGRLAFNRMKRPAPPKPLPEAVAGVPADITLVAEPPPTAPLIRALLDAAMFDDALNEVRYAQKAWGDTPVLQATIAWTNQQQAEGKKGMERFQLLRGGINQMRRAYPQFLAAGGENLPREVLTVIYPMAYWDLIRRYSAANEVDPYLFAALVAQESTFVADIRSHANAWGLAQLLPSTARQMARKLNLRYTTRLLTDPDANLRMGSFYFAEKIKEFGSTHMALASYNAGERAVRQWIAERPGVERDEFIDDIPYPETQAYVKRILGTAEDYRRLYGTTARDNN